MHPAKLNIPKRTGGTRNFSAYPNLCRVFPFLKIKSLSSPESFKSMKDISKRMDDQVN
jgi:hypothetical protein